VEARLEVTREQILAFRRSVGSLDGRLPRGEGSLRRAAWAGLQDSMPRAALLSIHARVEGTCPRSWADPSLAQLWGPRFSVYVVAERDRALFSLGRLPEGGAARRRAEDVAARLHAVLDGEVKTDREVGDALGADPNLLRYAAPTGTVLIRWEGARAPTVWTVPAPDMTPHEARCELARRYLHVFGPTSAGAFQQWAGLRGKAGDEAFDAIEAELIPVRTPLGDRLALGSDEAALRVDPHPPAPVRFLPSGDAYFLLWGVERELLVPDAAQRDELWTSRVWPGALLVAGEIVGTWRRKQGTVSIQTWRRLAPPEREAVEVEAEGLPLPDVDRIVVHWDV
jgi:hypothetical protein